MHRRVVLGAVALALVVGGLVTWRWLDTSDYEEAVATMPAATLRATYTDWAQVRELQDGGSLGAGSPPRLVDTFVDRAYNADLITTSAVYLSTYAMAREYGFSPLDVSWEMYGQSLEGAAAVMKLPESTDFAGIERNLERLGYDAGSGDVWVGSADLVAQIDPSLTDVLQNVVVLEREGVVLMSDSAAYASASADVVRGSADSLDEAADDLAGLAEEPVSAVMWADDFACEALSMSSADEEDKRVADQLVAAAGGVSPLSGLVMAHQRDRRLVVGMHFEDSDQAEANLRPRAELASGEALGQGGSFADRFDITTARSNGADVVLDLAPAGDDADIGLLGDLSRGPVLFATC